MLTFCFQYLIFFFSGISRVGPRLSDYHSVSSVHIRLVFLYYLQFLHVMKILVGVMDVIVKIMTVSSQHIISPLHFRDVIQAL